MNFGYKYSCAKGDCVMLYVLGIVFFVNMCFGCSGNDSTVDLLRAQLDTLKALKSADLEPVIVAGEQALNEASEKDAQIVRQIEDRRTVEDALYKKLLGEVSDLEEELARIELSKKDLEKNICAGKKAIAREKQRVSHANQEIVALKAELNRYKELLGEVSDLEEELARIELNQKDVEKNICAEMQAIAREKQRVWYAYQEQEAPKDDGSSSDGE